MHIGMSDLSFHVDNLSATRVTLRRNQIITHTTEL